MQSRRAQGNRGAGLVAQSRALRRRGRWRSRKRRGLQGTTRNAERRTRNTQRPGARPRTNHRRQRGGDSGGVTMAATIHPLFESPLPDEWRLVTVDEIKSPEKSSCVAGPFGSNISSKYFVESGVPVIRGGNLRNDLTRFVPEGFAFVSEEQATKYKAQHVRSGDLVFTCWGTVGQVGLIPDNGPFPEYIISNKQLKLRPNLEIADPVYLFFYFAGPKMVQNVLNKA